MEFRRILATIVGAIQSILGVLAVIFTCILYLEYRGYELWLSVQASLNVPVELLPLGLLVFSVFGFFLIISGLFLALEGLGRY